MKKAIPYALIMGGCLAVLSMIFRPWGWLFAIGVHPYPGPQTPWTYQLYSGFLPALTVLGLFTFIAGAWHHVNCHADGCWRIGKHKIGGTPWCSRHVGLARAQSDKLDEIIALLETIAHGLAPSSAPGAVDSPDSPGH